jgi:RHS repeat-associated protein
MTAYGAVLTAGYRADGLRAWKQTAAGRTYFLYDGITPVVELDAAGNVAATNTFGAAGLLSRRSGGASTFYTFDERGSVVQRLDGAAGVVSSRVFDGFGVGSSSVPTTDPFGFGGQWGYYRDAETGLELCTFRYYSAGAGRWLSRDPIGYDGAVNLYGYVGNSPLIRADPLGLADIKIDGEIYRTRVGDPDATKGLPHLDGPGRKWIDNTGRIHDPRTGKVKKVDKKDWPKVREAINDWIRKTGNQPTCPDDVKENHRREDGWWWNPQKGWQQDPPLVEDFSPYIIILPVPKWFPVFKWGRKGSGGFQPAPLRPAPMPVR